VKEVTGELSQLTTSLDAGDKSVDSARVSAAECHCQSMIFNMA